MAAVDTSDVTNKLHRLVLTCDCDNFKLGTDSLALACLHSRIKNICYVPGVIVLLKAVNSYKMPSVTETMANIKSSITTEVPAGSTAILNCVSNDYDHNFMFWLFDKNKVIGPGNDYDDRKYKYEVLSGKLHINSVTPTEAGYYKCVSRNLDGSGLSVGEVEMIVQGSVFTAGDAIKLVAILVSIIVIVSCAVIYFRLRREWKKEAQQLFPVDDADEEDGEEIYNSTTTTIPPQPVPGPSRNVSSEHLFGIDNQGLDTDFNSVFENIQIKTPHTSLI